MTAIDVVKIYFLAKTKSFKDHAASSVGGKGCASPQAVVWESVSTRGETLSTTAHTAVL